LAKARQLALELIGLVELHRSLEPVGFADWLPQRASEREDLYRSIEETFQVNLFLLARTVQEQSSCVREAGQRPRLAEHAISASEYEQWWSMAWQWSRAQNAFVIPSNWPQTEVVWDRWIAHWKGLESLLWSKPVDLEQRWIVLRCFSDEANSVRMNQLLEDVRAEQGILTLVTLRYQGDASVHPFATESIAWWQTEWLRSISPAIREGAPEGFVRDTGELGLFFRDSDRSEMSQMVRDALTQMQGILGQHGLLGTGQPVPMIAGIASVDGPAKSFRIGQLLDAADRCLANAASQGPGTVKSIEVF
jgi:hypothetical protein